jgi:hypothetical protein
MTRAWKTVALAIAFAVAFPAAPLFAQDGRLQPIIADIDPTTRGPLAKVLSFRVNPVLKERRTPQTILTDESLRVLGNSGYAAGSDAATRAANEEGWSIFTNAFGGSSGVGTLAEHAGKLEGMSGINGALTNLGLFVTVWQVGLDVSRGDNRSAGANSYKGMLSFAISKWGWSALQVGGVALFVVDQTLTTVGQGAWLARTDAWRQAYTLYYAQGDKAALASEYGVQPILKPTLEERLRALRGRPEAGRSLNDWKVLIGHLYASAKSAEDFQTRLHAELDDYAKWFWRSDQMAEILSDLSTGQVGINRLASLTDEIKGKLESEHKAALVAMLVAKVFPELTWKAFLKALDARVAEMNAKVVPELNSPYLIDISAYGLDAPADFRMPLPAGGAWSGKLQPGQTRRLYITRFAFLQAQLPDTIELTTATGTETQRFKPSNGVTTVVFGRPEAALITAYTRSEMAGTCEAVETLKSGEVRNSTSTRPAPAPDVIHYAMPVPGQTLLGHYDPAQGWLTASPGSLAADGKSLQFAAPYLDDIAGLSACTGAFMSGDLLAGAQCTAERRSTAVSATGVTETRCLSPISLEIKGVYLRQGDAMQYYALDGPEGAVLRNALREGMKQITGVTP